MKKILRYAFFAMALAAMTSCSDQFLQDKKDYNGFNEEIYDDIALATGKVDFVYGLCLPTTASGVGHSNPCTGRADAFSQSTEEYAGSTTFTQLAEILSSNVPDYFYNKNTDGPWSRIRECNIFLGNIDKGALGEADRNKLKGQIYFWRAWIYTRLVMMYGGVPIVTTAQNAILGDGSSKDELEVQRSSTADCIDFICEDLDKAIAMLPGKWDNSNWGRITSGAAAALKGRLLLAYASPLFNRNDDQVRWQAAYDANKAAYDLLIQNGFGLADGKGNRAENWEKMFCQIQSSEAVMVTLFNTLTNDYKKNNSWEQMARPKELLGGGGMAATAEMVDLFPMADGKKPGESVFEYDELKFYKNRDPRFYRTFAFNGVVWPYKMDNGYTLWNYQWYKDEDSFESGKPGNSAQYSGDVNSGIFVRKRTNPEAQWDNANKFNLSATPYMEIRFAEVVLNLAESACGIGKKDDAVELLKDIRERVGYTGDCGLAVAELKADRDKLFSAILYERQIELAYEGKRFDDMRRWMLWNDDFGTCTRLGVEPLNGKRRHGMFLAVKPSVYTETKAGQDYDVFNPDSKAYDASKVTRAGIGLDPSSSDEEFMLQIEKLDKFYDTNLVRHENDQIDGTSTPRFEITFLNKYYFIGLKESVMKQSPYLYQNMNWEDYYGSEGTFDPLK